MYRFAPGVGDEILFRAERKARRTGATQSMIDKWESEYIDDLYDFFDQIAQFPNSGNPSKRPPDRVLTSSKGKSAGDIVIWEVEPNGDVVIKGVVDFI